MKRLWISAVLAAVLTVVLILILSGCGVTDEQPVPDDGGNRLAKVCSALDWNFSYRVIEDRVTGVQYLVVTYYDKSTSVTPVLNADGTPYIANRNKGKDAE